LRNVNIVSSFDTLKRGFMSGLKITWKLSKILVPVYFIVTVLKYTPIINWISMGFAPLMKFFGLPGEAAIVFVMGNFVNLYAAIGAMASLDLTLKEIYILAIMLSFCHSLIVETALAKKIGLSAINVITVRIGLAVVSGITFNFLL
jgi:hypothetical protein